MTLYLKRPGQEDGDPVGTPGEYEDGGGSGAELDDWGLYLPHRCQAWDISHGTRESVAEDARALRAELSAAIRMLEEPATPFARLQRAAAESSQGAGLSAMQTVRRVYQLAQDWKGRPDRADAARELLDALGMTT